VRGNPNVMRSTVQVLDDMMHFCVLFQYYLLIQFNCDALNCQSVRDSRVFFCFSSKRYISKKKENENKKEDEDEDTSVCHS